MLATELFNKIENIYPRKYSTSSCDKFCCIRINWYKPVLYH